MSSHTARSQEGGQRREAAGGARRRSGKRRGRDSNPRPTFRQVRDFQSRSFGRSDTSPSAASVAAPSARGTTSDSPRRSQVAPSHRDAIRRRFADEELLLVVKPAYKGRASHRLADLPTTTWPLHVSGESGDTTWCRRHSLPPGARADHEVAWQPTGEELRERDGLLAGLDAAGLGHHEFGRFELKGLPCCSSLHVVVVASKPCEPRERRRERSQAGVRNVRIVSFRARRRRSPPPMRAYAPPSGKPRSAIPPTLDDVPLLIAVARQPSVTRQSNRLAREVPGRSPSAPRWSPAGIKTIPFSSFVAGRRRGRDSNSRRT